LVKIQMAKNLGGLKVVDEEGEKVLRKLGLGEIVSVDVVRPRNGKFHNKFMSMVRLIYQNQEYYPSVDALLQVLKLEVGHYDLYRTDTEEYKIPKSINFAAMDDLEFSDFYNAACKWVCEKVIPGLERMGLDEAVAEELRDYGAPEG